VDKNNGRLKDSFLLESHYSRFTFNTLASGRCRGFSHQNQRIARGFLAQVALAPKAVERLKRCDRSFSLHSKNFFSVGGADFL